MDRDTLLAGLDFARTRLLNTLDAIEKSGQDMNKVLAWRPAPGRAHIGWQAMHCATTHDKYLNVYMKSAKPRDEARIASFGGGSTPSDQQVPDLSSIRSALEAEIQPLREYVRGLQPEDFGRKLSNGRSVGESILLLAWHEAHHQGQIHLTWNLYKQTHGIA